MASEEWERDRERERLYVHVQDRREGNIGKSTVLGTLQKTQELALFLLYINISSCVQLTDLDGSMEKMCNIQIYSLSFLIRPCDFLLNWNRKTDKMV